MASVRLGYLRLGNPLTTLCGGERQRLKLALDMLRIKPSFRPRQQTRLARLPRAAAEGRR
jgi:ABC-type cobalamin transport system ATPase subunit